jgi:hypothetical protein
VVENPLDWSVIGGVAKILAVMLRYLVVIFPLLLLLSGRTAATPPTIADCTIFPADNVWNIAVDNLPVPPSSYLWMRTLLA